MSYDVYLEDAEGCVLEVESHSEGGTYAIGGLPEAHLNITYNYGECYSLFEFSIRNLDGKTAAETVEQLDDLVGKLGTRQYHNDYWAPTPGNAGYALSILAKWAKQHPDGLWSVS